MMWTKKVKSIIENLVVPISIFDKFLETLKKSHKILYINF